MLCTTVEKNGEKRYAPEDQHYYALEKMPSLSRKHDGENPRTNTAMHQKKCPHFPENTMEKTQGPTLLRFEKMPSLSRKHGMEKTQEKTMEKTTRKAYAAYVGCTHAYGGSASRIVE